MSGRGHRKLRLSSKKHYETKKAEQAASKPLPISIPVSVYESTPAPDTSTLLNRLQLSKVLERGRKFVLSSI